MDIRGGGGARAVRQATGGETMAVSDHPGALLRLAPRAREVPPEHIRLLTKIARMYHERGIRQPQIAAQLNVSQARVSRLLKQAVELGIVRTIVISPPGLHGDLEEAIEAKYGLREVVVADTGE